MNKRKLYIISGKKLVRSFKYMMLGLVCCIFIGNMVGCSYKSRIDYMAQQTRSEKKQADELMQSIIDALEAEDAEALRGLFSTYAVENSLDLDEKIEELMDFYPGCDDGYGGNISTSETNNYGEKVLIIYAQYTVTNNDEIYQMNITTQLENDEDPEKIGVYMIEVMTEEAEPEGFKWRTEEDSPGIYVLE